MGIIILLAVASVSASLTFLFAFLWATQSGQYDDTATPPLRMLGDDDVGSPLHASHLLRHTKTK